MSPNRLKLHRARWLVTLDSDAGLPVVIGDGGLLEDGTSILAVGSFAGLAREHGRSLTVDHGEVILSPALVNAHAHLELSLFAETGQRDLAPETPFPDWIRALIGVRRKGHEEKGLILAADMLRAGRQALSAMRKRGTGPVADTGNLMESGLISDRSGPDVLFLLELLGISREGEDASLARLAGSAVEVRGEMQPAVDPESAVTAHAPYSTGPRLLREIKKRAIRKNTLLSIHLGESLAEVEFLQSGTGPFKEFLDEHGGCGGSFRVPGVSPTVYLDQLGLLDPSTICVHGVQLTEDEIDLLAARGAHLCLCPASNRRLAVGVAPVGRMVGAGIRPALGTDSLASNGSLDLWEEMRVLRSDHPGIEPAGVFAMATVNGAQALGHDRQWGALAAGRHAKFLKISGPVMDRGSEVLDYLTTAGTAIKCSWV